MKSTRKSLLLHFAIALTVIIASSGVHGAENPFSSLWPFGKSKVTTPTFASPFAGSKKSKSGSFFNGPSRFFEKAEKQTGVIFKKTKNGLQDFGRSLNPFSKPEPQKKSFLDRVFPKQPVDNGPSTVGEFLNMDRPGF